MRRNFPRRQSGAALFIALIMLLIITLLAVSSAREVTLEYRMTGNFLEQQRLLNAAESALREGERSITAPAKPLNATTTCAPQKPCLLDQDPEYKQVFDKGVGYGGANNNEGPSNINITWYAVPLPADIPNGQAGDPEYGNLMQGIGTFRYEVNSESRNAQGETTRLRSTTAKVFN